MDNKSLKILKTLNNRKDGMSNERISEALRKRISFSEVFESMSFLENEGYIAQNPQTNPVTYSITRKGREFLDTLRAGHLKSATEHFLFPMIVAFITTLITIKLYGL